MKHGFWGEKKHPGTFAGTIAGLGSTRLNTVPVVAFWSWDSVRCFPQQTACVLQLQMASGAKRQRRAPTRKMRTLDQQRVVSGGNRRHVQQGQQGEGHWVRGRKGGAPEQAYGHIAACETEHLSAGFPPLFRSMSNRDHCRRRHAVTEVPSILATTAKPRRLPHTSTPGLSPVAFFNTSASLAGEEHLPSAPVEGTLPDNGAMPETTTNRCREAPARPAGAESPAAVLSGGTWANSTKRVRDCSVMRATISTKVGDHFQPLRYVYVGR